ncbi:MAG: hypothetical protein V9G10_02635 [Candidatus Nanopelagicales bacterium]
MGERSIIPMGHVRMMAAVQPFLSGAISKTVNMPESASIADVEEIYYEGWKLGLKALAIYRDNCKVGQPLSDAQGREGGGAGRGQPGGPQVRSGSGCRRSVRARPSRSVSAAPRAT